MSNRLAPKRRTLGRETSGFKYPALSWCCPNSLSTPSPKQQGLENLNAVTQATFIASSLTTGGKEAQQMAVSNDRAQDEVTDFTILLIAVWSAQV